MVMKQKHLLGSPLYGDYGVAAEECFRSAFAFASASAFAAASAAADEEEEGRRGGGTGSSADHLLIIC